MPALPPARTAALGLAAAGALGVGLLVSGDDGPVLCPFRHLTGGYCPACGMTRAVGRLLRGDPAGSWHQHPVLLLLTAQAAVLAAAWAVAARRQPGGPNPVRTFLIRHGDTLQVANGVLLVVVWLIRLATHAIPVPFA